MSHQSIALSRSIVFAGHEALEVLQKGSLLRKKWLENNDANEAQQIQKTERLIRCRVENNKVVLHYYHQVSTQLKDTMIAAFLYRPGPCPNLWIVMEGPLLGSCINWAALEMQDCYGDEC